MPDSAPRQRPLEVARDTFVIRAITPSVARTFTALNSMVIRAAEPVLVRRVPVTGATIPKTLCAFAPWRESIPLPLPAISP